MRYISVDVETTSTSTEHPENIDIIEFAAVADDLTVQAPTESLPTFHCYFSKEFYVGSAGSLAMHAETFRRINNREEPYHYYNANKFGNMFKQWLVRECGYEIKQDRVKINAAGKNFASFDLPVLRRKTDFFKHVGIRNRILDPAILYVQKDDIAVPGMAKCKERAMMKDYVAHTALPDAYDIVELIRTSIGPIFLEK